MFTGTVTLNKLVEGDEGGKTLILMQVLRSVSNSLLDSSIAVKSAASSCFATLSRRVPEGERVVLTQILNEKLLPSAQQI